MILPEKINVKLYSDKQARDHIQFVQKLGKKVVFTNGCFDILHTGHAIYLHEAKEKGDLLVVGLNSDDSVKRLKGEGRPIRKEMDRAILLASLESISMVVMFDEDTPERLIKMLKPDVLVKGGDYTLPEIVGADFVKSYGGEVVIIPFVKGLSSSNIIEKIIKTYSK